MPNESRIIMSFRARIEHNPYTTNCWRKLRRRPLRNLNICALVHIWWNSLKTISLNSWQMLKNALLKQRKIQAHAANSSSFHHLRRNNWNLLCLPLHLRNCDRYRSQKAKRNYTQLLSVAKGNITGIVSKRHSRSIVNQPGWYVITSYRLTKV